MLNKIFKLILKHKIGLILAIFCLSGGFYLVKINSYKKFSIQNSEKTIIFNDNGIISKTFTKTNLVKNFLLEKNIKLKDKDIIFPDLNESLSANSKIMIKRSKAVKLDMGGEKKEFFTNANNVLDFLFEEKIEYSSNDKIIPPLNAFLHPDTEIKIIKVSKKNEIVEKKIPFKKMVKKDLNLDFNKSKVVQEGINGLEEREYQIVYEDGKEVKKTLIAEKIIKEPRDQIIVEGVKITPVATESGFASWYFGLGALSAAHKTYPFGTKVKVINKLNNKSVIITINDRGPYIDGRIIDLSKDAFSEIASIGAGVVPVVIQRLN